jgi:hypothetical protein
MNALFQFLSDAIETVKADWRDWQPYICSECGHVTRGKKITYVLHRVAGWVAVCDSCYRCLYPGGRK